MANITPARRLKLHFWIPETASPLLHPFVLFSSLWLSVIGLYSLHFSKILQYSTQEALIAVLFVWVPFSGAIFCYNFIRQLVLLGYQKFKKTESVIDITLVDRRLTSCFLLWLAMTIVEIIFSGGVPIVWAITHGSKIYSDFGIPSVHGLVNSLLLSVALCRYGLFLIAKRRRDLIIPVFVILWTIIIINRNMLLVSLLQFGVIYLRLRRVRFTLLIQCGLAMLLFVLAFGVVGDIRQGSSDSIRVLAQPTEQYPDWMPSGVLWAYIYITTPINNLIYTMQSFRPINSLLFPNTVATLFPTVIRTIYYGDQLGQAESGNLVVDAFNVSTAYVGPYQDYGYIGVAAFSIFTAFVCQLFWFKTKFRDVLIFSVLTQCLLITLFFNHFFLLPVIGQVFWLLYFFMPQVYLGNRSMHP